MEPRIALVTGASSGIGKALSVELGRRGYKVGLTARRAKELEETAQAIAAAGGEAHVEACDVTDRAAVEAAAAALAKRFGRIDLLVANAGIGVKPERGKLFDVDGIERTMRVNVLGVAYSIGAVLPAMLERKSGHIAAVSSIASYIATPRTAGYSASKAAVSVLLDSLRLDVRGRGVDVTVVNPGFVATPMTAKNKGMVLVWTAEKAARVIADGLERRKRTIEFPFPLVAGAKLARSFVPGWLFDRLVAGRAW
ncbi:MAG TPA: SDR family NAD(P)-dependent oxidoreductase [Planctomycetota bacterium]|nr:SDR family NAD(P)-dependent oxidoreductase [Planctomycetota bacterium]